MLILSISNCISSCRHISREIAKKRKCTTNTTQIKSLQIHKNLGAITEHFQPSSFYYPISQKQLVLFYNRWHLPLFLGILLQPRNCWDITCQWRQQTAISKKKITENFPLLDVGTSSRPGPVPSSPAAAPDMLRLVRVAAGIFLGSKR